MSKASAALPAIKPSPARFGVLGFVCVLSMITYLDRVCFGSVGPFIQSEFGLSDGQLGLLFTAFALAYAVFEVPSGWLGDVYGPRRTLIRIVLWWSLFTALTGAIHPIAAAPMLGFGLLLTVRFLFGVGEAGAYPNITRALHNWFPFTERGIAQGAVWMAGRFGGGITPLVVLALLYHEKIPVWLTTNPPRPASIEVVHWRHMFWIFGGIGIVWCVSFWAWFRDHPPSYYDDLRAPGRWRGTSSPSGSEAILSAEQHEGLAPEPQADPPGVGTDPNPVVPDIACQGHRNVPWGRLLSSTNLWVLCLMYFCAAYGWYFNITWLPKYLRTEFNLSEQTHGFWTMSLLSGMPLLFGALACLVGGMLTDRFIYRTGNRKWGRRLFGVIGHSTCALCYFLSLTASSPWLFVLAVAMASFCNDLTMGAAWASCQDIGREYTAIVSGCMNTVGNIGGAAAGYITGLVLEVSRTHRWNGWAINFVIFGSVYLLAVVFWMFFDATKPVAD
jgi:MFS family permease